MYRTSLKYCKSKVVIHGVWTERIATLIVPPSLPLLLFPCIISYLDRGFACLEGRVSACLPKLRVRLQKNDIIDPFLKELANEEEFE